MTFRTHYLMIALLAGFGLALGACGGSGADAPAEPVVEMPAPEPEPTAYAVALPAGHGLSLGMTTVPAGETTMLASGTYLTCAGEEDCTLTIAMDSVTGATSASSTGGMVTVSTTATRLAGVHAMNQQTLANAREALAALEAMDPGDVPANDLAAAQMAVADALMLPGNENEPENVMPPEPMPTEHAVELPDGHGLTEGDTTIEAGGSVETPTGATVMCEEGGESCMITVSRDAVTGEYTASSTGGMATVTLPEEPMEPEPTPAVALTLPAGNSVFAAMAALGESTSGTITVAAGGFQDFGGVRFSCPAGGEDCVVTITRDLASASATTGGEGSGSATTGAIPVPNPVFGGGNAAGYLSNANLLAALTGQADGANTVPTLGAGFDRTGDGFADGGVRMVNNAPVALPLIGTDNPALTGFEQVPGLALALGGGVTMDLYTTAAASTQRAFATVIGANFVTPAQDPAFWSRISQDSQGALISGGSFTASNGGNIAVSYRGADGTLVCTSGTCSISTVNSGTGVSSATGAWRFDLGDTNADGTPDGNINVPDADYLVFGWWRQAAGLTSVQTDVVWAGSDPYNAASLAGLTGTATYNGGAVGHYEERKLAASGRNSGQFRATASITADFSNNLIRGSLTNILDATGAVNAGVVAGNTDLPNNLSVTLVTTGLSAPTFNGSTSISVGSNPQSTTGSWNGQLFGNGPAAQLVTQPPTGVAGEFTAFTGARSMAAGEIAGNTPVSAYINLQGAFGAD